MRKTFRYVFISATVIVSTKISLEISVVSTNVYVFSVIDSSQTFSIFPFSLKRISLILICSL